MLSVAEQEDEAALRHNIRLEQDAGVDVEFIDPTRISEYVPHANSEDVAAAAIEHDAGFADPYLVATGFAHAAQSNDAAILTDTEVTDLITSRGRIQSAKTTAGALDVDAIVNAGGPGAKAIASLAGIDLPLQCYKTECGALPSMNPTPSIRTSWTMLRSISG